MFNTLLLTLCIAHNVQSGTLLLCESIHAAQCSRHELTHCQPWTAVNITLKGSEAVINHSPSLSTKLLKEVQSLCVVGHKHNLVWRRCLDHSEQVVQHLQLTCINDINRLSQTNSVTLSLYWKKPVAILKETFVWYMPDRCEKYKVNNEPDISGCTDVGR